MYYCRVEKDSISPIGSRLTSMIITFPRIVLAEVVTHRVNSDTWGDEFSVCERTTTPDISKNSASSRAISFKKMVEKVKADPFMPFWTIEQRGMQGDVSNDEAIIERANYLWLQARESMIGWAEGLSMIGIHKQDCNRLLEPWCWVTQIVTSSRWDNFFALRCHKAAHPAFRHIARMMFLERKKSTPKKLTYNQWHLPFVSDEDQEKFQWDPMLSTTLPNLIKFSAARCAWVSYCNHDNEGTPEKMLGTFDKLFAEIPVHASPVEHQATPMSYRNSNSLRSNLAGWIQARKLLKHEEVKEYNPSEEEIKSWNMKV